MNNRYNLTPMTLLSLSLLGIYNGLLVLSFYMAVDPFFIKALLLVIVSITILFFQKKKIFRSFKFFIPLVMIFTIILSLFFTQKLYVIMTRIYLDGTVVITVNNKRIDNEDSKRLKELFLNLEEYNVTVYNADPTYTLSYMGEDDLDYRHIHVFKEEKLVIRGCLLGVEEGDTVEGYLLTDELLNILKRQ